MKHIHIFHHLVEISKTLQLVSPDLSLFLPSVLRSVVRISASRQRTSNFEVEQSSFNKSLCLNPKLGLFQHLGNRLKSYVQPLTEYSFSISRKLLIAGLTPDEILVEISMLYFSDRLFIYSTATLYSSVTVGVQVSTTTC